MSTKSDITTAAVNRPNAFIVVIGDVTLARKDTAVVNVVTSIAPPALDNTHDKRASSGVSAESLAKDCLQASIYTYTSSAPIPNTKNMAIRLR